MKKSSLRQVQRIVFFAVFSILALASFAQNPNNYEDVVYLKNGNIYRGLIIEQVPNVSLKIRSQDRNVFAVQLSEVEKITKEEMPNNFYRNRYFEGRMNRSNFDEKGSPTTLNGTYLTWGLGVGASENEGFACELGAGRKIFNHNPKPTKTHAFIGTDIFGFVGGVFGKGAAADFGINIGPSFAWKFKNGHKGILYLTPYSGINVNTGKRVDNQYGYYDNNGNYYPNNDSYHFTTVTFPVGIKLEYNYKQFFCGVNANMGLGVGTQNGSYQGVTAAARLMFSVGIKF